MAIREWNLGLTYNPVLNIRKPAPAPGRNRRLTQDEEVRMINAVDRHSNPMFGWIVKTALFTAMRAGEITSLRRGQIDLKKRIIHLPKTKNGEARNVPLTLRATDVIRQALENPVKSIDTDLIFYGEPGKDEKRRPYVWEKTRNALVKREGLIDLHFHDLRHEAVSRFVEAGLSDQKVSAISGHKSMQMLKPYTHLRGDDLVEELDRINPL